MRRTHMRDTARAWIARHVPRAREHISNYKEAASRVSMVASFFVVAGVMLFASSATVLAEQLPPVSNQQLRAGAQDIQTFVDKTPNNKLAGRQADLEQRFAQAFDTGSDWNWWDQKDLNTCAVVEKLGELMQFIQWLRDRQREGRAALEELYARTWMMRNDVLQNIPADKPCKGFERVGYDPAVRIDSQDNKHVNFGVNFATPSLTTVVGNDQTFTRVHIPGIENMVGTPGEPAVPQWRKLIAIPEGSRPFVAFVRPTKSESLKLNLVPFQEQAVDAARTPSDKARMDTRSNDDVYADKPFKINEESYRKDALLPAQPCKVTPAGKYRDVNMAQIECTTGQYNPVTDQFLMHTAMDVEIQFKGGEGTYITSHTFNEFEGAAKLSTEAVINKDILKRYPKVIDISNRICWGEELLILTHSSFREAADRLAVHKQSIGLSTNVFNVGADVPGRATAEEIDKFIENRYDECKVRPSYVLLMGDAEFIPTFYPPHLADADNTGSDFPYSNYVQVLFDAFFPDFATGRVPVDTLDQANTVVDKIINYETDPPHLGITNGGPFYNTVGLASQFQCCRMNADGTPLNNQAGTDQRAFIQTSEFVRQEMVDRGYTVPRLYTETVDNGGYCIQQNGMGVCTKTQAAYNGNTTPRRYFNGGLLPSALGAGSGFAWNATTADISNAWNDGRFLFIHRDHGWPGGWADPGFSTGNVNALSNGERLPVVWSVNCASGLFDNETAGGTYNTTANGVYFAEAALRKADGGAIGVIGDTRNSPTWANNALTRGFSDAVWPNTVPEHGGTTSFKRLGDTLNWGKVYLAGQVGVDQPAGSVSVNDMGYEYHIWHVIGDPSLKMWTSNPYRLVLSDKVQIMEQSRAGELLKYAKNGATITKLQTFRDGTFRALGRATVVNGEAKMTYINQAEADAFVSYSVSFDDSVSIKVAPSRASTAAPTR